MRKGWTKWEPGPRGNEGRRRRRRLEKGAVRLDEGLCKTALRQRLIRCSCWRSESTVGRVCVRHGDAGDTNEHVFTFIVPMSSMKKILPVSQRRSLLNTFSQNLDRFRGSTFLSARRETLACILHCEVFFF